MAHDNTVPQYKHSSTPIHASIATLFTQRSFYFHMTTTTPIHASIATLFTQRSFYFHITTTRQDFGAKTWHFINW